MADAKPIRIDASGLLGRSTNDQFLAGVVLSITTILRDRKFNENFERLSGDLTAFTIKAEGTEFTEMLAQYPFEAILVVVRQWELRAPSVTDFDMIYTTVSNQFTWMKTRGLLGRFSVPDVKSLCNWDIFRAECCPDISHAPLDIASALVDAAISVDDSPVLVAKTRRALREINFKLCPCTIEGVLAQQALQATHLMDDARDTALLDLARDYALPYLAVLDAHKDGARWSFIGSNHYQMHVVRTESAVEMHIGLGFCPKQVADLPKLIHDVTGVPVVISGESPYGDLLVLVLSKDTPDQLVRAVIEFLCPTISNKALDLI